MTARLVALLGAVVICWSAWAGDPPRPRPPLGPTIEMNSMLPEPGNPLPESLPKLSADRIRVYNVGNQSLNIMYWDGNKWQPETIGSRRYAEPSCSNCAGLITLAFHDGKEVKNILVKGGGTYWLGWDPKAATWTLTLPPTQ